MKKLYIIHGWTYEVSPWLKIVKALKTAEIDATLLRVPGLAVKSDKVWTIEDYCAWADQNIPNGSIALGHSNGGRILMNLAVKQPDKLHHLILLDSAGVYEHSLKRSFLRIMAKIFSPLKHIKPLRKLFHKTIGASDYDKAPDNMKVTLHNMIQSDRKLDPSKIITPTSIIWGGKDTVTPLRHAGKLHKSIQGSHLSIHREWTHSPYLTDPQGLTKAIIKVIRNIP
jgi:pimeloyl-[acyl-carrier protein] methyl ester esterase